MFAQILTRERSKKERGVGEIRAATSSGSESERKGRGGREIGRARVRERQESLGHERSSFNIPNSKS